MNGRGAMTEQLTIQSPAPVAVAIASLTRSSGTATATTAAAHGFLTGDYVTVAGATPAAYTGKVKVTVTSPTVFTYAVSGSPSTPATGDLSATYASDASGGRESVWATVAADVWAEPLPFTARERLQLQAVQSTTTHRFKVDVRSDVTAEMRLLWTPSWINGGAQRVIGLTADPVPFDDGRTYMVLEGTERGR